MKKETRETIKNLRLFDPTCCIAAVIEIYAMLQECKLQPEGDWLYVFTPEQYKRKVLAAVLSIMDITGMNITGVSRINKWNEFKSAWLNKKQPSHCYTIGDARMSKKSLDSLCELAQEVSGARPALVFVSNISHKRPPKQYWQITSSDAEFFKSVNSVYFFKSAYSECKCRVITGKKNSIKADIEITRKADIEITPSKKPISPMLRDFKCSRGSSLWDNHGLLLLKDDSEIQDAMWNNLTGYIKTYCCKKEIEWRGNRKCLWLKDANKTDLSNNPWLKPRLEAIDIYRKAKRTEKNSIRGECHEFGIIRQPSSGYYLALPYIKYNERKHYKGKYIIGAVLSSTEEIAGEDLLVVTNAKQDTDSIYFAFAIASTQAFKIWFDMIMADSSRKIRTSFNIWNTFPFPQIGTNKLEFIKTAKEVLAKREELRNLGKNLPVIYSDLAKYQSLKEAHLELDELSLIAFGLPLNLNVATAIGRHKLENALRDSYEKLSSSRASQHSIDSV